MVSDNRHALWNSYFEADFRYRYFLGLKDRLHKRLLRLSLAIALLSAGALTNLLWQRAEQGEDVRSEAEALDEQLAVTDSAAIKELRRVKKLELEAFAESEAALSPV